MGIDHQNLNVTLKKINAGNKKAFEDLFNTYYRSLCYFSHKIIDDFEASKDIVQDIFIKIWDKNLIFENSNTLNAYLYNSVKNKSITYLEKINNRHVLNKKFEATDYNEENFIRKQIESEVISEIFQAIDELPEECMKIFKLSYIQHYKNQEIAETLNISVNTVKTQKTRAKKQLKEKLQDLFPLFFIFFY